MPIKNHFIAKINNNFFDITGLVTIDEEPIKWSEYQIIDPVHAQRITRDCINFSTR